MKLAHRPVRAPRKGHDGEEVYAEEWRILMHQTTDEGEPFLHDIFSGMYRPTLRRSVVAASLICWLGTNCGQSILIEAKRRRSEGERYPTLLAWTTQNIRYSWVNSGVRTIEAVLATDDCYGTTYAGTYGVVRTPNYSAEDIDTVERVLLWLDQPKGIAFVHRCETEIRERQSERGRRARAEARANYNTGVPKE